MTAATTTTRLTGRTVLVMLCAGFGIVLAVNLAMVWLALDSWPGLVSDTAYRDGLEFNRVLAAGERQKELGWQLSLEVPDGVIEMEIAGPDGMPVDGLSVNAMAYRPASEGSDRRFDLLEVSPGRYRATAALPLEGNWNVVIDAVRDGQPYHVERRIFVEP